jgi:hypothetical protein
VRGGAEEPCPPRKRLSKQQNVNFTTPDRKARRISSTESFRADLEFGAALAFGTSINLKVTMFMLGILYAQL